jgi:hypothetical protein
LTVTQRVMAGTVNTVMHIGCTKTRNFIPVTINHTVAQTVESLHCKPEDRGLESR